jgi:hypothetical protein
MTSKLKHFAIALKLSKVVASLILFGRHIVQAMTGNVYFTTLTAAITALSTDLDALEVAEATAKRGGKGTAAARDLKLKTVETDLTALAANVAQIANQNLAQGAAIIASSGFTEKKHTVHPKANLAASMSETPNEVILRAKAIRGAYYAWQMSTDGGKTWIAIGGSTEANYSVPNLTLGQTYLFRFQTTLKKVASEWSQTISFMVH